MLGWSTLGCEVDEPCMDNDPELVEKFGVPEHQTLGSDGLCYTVDPAVKNWGAPCDSLELCGGGLICPGEQLPICTAMGCNPDPEKDKVCGRGFTCIETGEADAPTICIPLPPAPPPAPAPDGDESSGPGPEVVDGGASDAAPAPETEAGLTTEAVEVEPNIGTACSAADDPVCVGGAFCEAQSLGYCTVANCAAGLENEATCAAAAGFCYSSPPAPATGICSVQ